MGLLCSSQTKTELVSPSYSLRLCSSATSESQGLNARFPGPLIPKSRTSRDLSDQRHSVPLASGILHLSQGDGRIKTQCLVNQPLVSAQARRCGKPWFQRESVSGQKAPARANLPRLWTTVEKFPHERHKAPFPLGVAETVREHTQLWHSFHSGA